MRISVILPVYCPTPFLRAMTEFCITALKQHAAKPFELVVVEVGNKPYFDKNSDVDKYVWFQERTGHITKEFNAGCDKATGDLLVHAGNDVIVPPMWDDLLREPFDLYGDCGISCLAAKEPGAIIGYHEPIPFIVEGMYSPFMAFRNSWRFDEAYLGCYCDSDLVMRVYQNGQRSYRNLRSHVWHMNCVTHTYEPHPRRQEEVSRGEALFYDRWGKSPLWIFGMIRGGQIIWGREHESFLRPIERHT